MHQKGGDLNRDRQVARPDGWLDRVANTQAGISTANLGIASATPKYLDRHVPNV